MRKPAISQIMKERQVDAVITELSLLPQHSSKIYSVPAPRKKDSTPLKDN